MIDAALVPDALEPVRDLLRTDGGDIELVGVEGDVVSLRLLLADANCAECVLPRPMLELVAMDLMAPLVPGLGSLSIDDPRED